MFLFLNYIYSQLVLITCFHLNHFIMNETFLLYFLPNGFCFNVSMITQNKILTNFVNYLVYLLNYHKSFRKKSVHYNVTFKKIQKNLLATNI